MLKRLINWFTRTITKTSNWYSFHVCKECNSRLSNHENLNSNGVCPYCGKMSQLSKTMCDTDIIILRCTTKYKRNKFWSRSYTYEGRNNVSKAWLNWSLELDRT